MVAHSAFLVERGANFPEYNVEIAQACQAAAEQWHTLALHLAVPAQALEDLQTLRHVEKLHAFEIKANNLRRLKIGTDIDHWRQRWVRTPGKHHRHFRGLTELHIQHRGIGMGMQLSG